MEKRTVDDVNAGASTPIPASPTIPPAIAIDGGFRDCLPSALAWAARGFTVFRLGEGRKDAKGIYFLETGVTNPDEIARSFQPGTRSNIGWCTGRTFHGHWVAIDLDVKDGRKGPETMLRAARKAGVGAVSVEQLAAATGAVLVRTPSGGYHLIYDGGVALDYSQSSGLWAEEFGKDCGVDVRARHGYCVAPGSWVRGKDGAIAYYDVVGEPAGAIGALPEWIKDRLLTHAERSRGALEVSGHNGSALVRLNGVLVSGKGQGEWSPEVIEDARRGVLHERLRAIKGNRNNTGYVVAAYLRRNMAFSVGLARELLDVWNEKMCQPAMEPWRLDALAEHAGRYGKDTLGIGNWDAVYAAVGEVVGAQEVEGRGWAARMDKQASEDQAAFKAQMEWGAALAKARAAGRATPEAPISVFTNGVRLDFQIGRPDYIPPLRPIWPGWLDCGYLTLLTGARKIGKSQLLLWLASTISQGGELPYGGGKAPRGDVYLLSCEDDYERAIVPRLAALGADFDRIIFVKGVKDAQGNASWFSLQNDMESIGATIMARAARGYPAQAVFIDPASSYTGKAKVNDEGEIRMALQGLNVWGAKHDVMVMILRHPKKGADSTGNRTSGTHAWEDIPRRIFELQIDEEDENEDRWARKRYLFNTLYSYGRPAKTLGFKIKSVKVNAAADGSSSEWRDTSAVSWEPEIFDIEPEDNYKRKRQKEMDEIKPQEPTSKLGEAKEFILEALDSGEPFLVSAIWDCAKGSGIKEEAFKRAKVQLKKDGMIKLSKQGFQGTWWMQLAEKGKNSFLGLPPAPPCT